MNATAWFPRFVIRTGLRGGLTLALLIGAGQAALARAPRHAGATGLATTSADQAVTLAQAAVAQAPQDAARRAALGQAYLRAGRFEAAALALGDAAALGDSVASTTLSLALAQIACGQNRAALATLDRGAATIPPAELGLALALAGDTERGTAILIDGAQSGASTVRLRQNLAYAYALAGRWADARLTAGFDLPPNQADARLLQWAQMMQSGGERISVARLLDVPVVGDPGQPAALALNGPGADTGAAPVRNLVAANTDAAGELLAVTPPPATDAGAKRFASRP